MVDPLDLAHVSVPTALGIGLQHDLAADKGQKKAPLTRG
jgi:hypothetical protein